MAMKPTKRKVRKFAEGEFIDNDSESGEWAGDEDYGDGTTRAERVAMARAPGYKAKSSLTEDETSDYGPKGGRGAAGTSETETPTKKSFKDAFASARADKQGTFEWNGKKYSTAMAGETKAPAMGGARNTRTGAPAGGAETSRGEQASVRKVDNAIAAKAATGAGAGRGGQGGPTADELESYSKQQAVKRAFTPPSKEDTQKGLEIMAGAPGLKAISAAARGLASRGAGAAEKLREYIQPQLSAPTKRLTGPAAKEATDVTPKALPSPKASAKPEAEVSAKGREEVMNPLMWAAGPKNAGKFKEGAEKAPRKPKKALDESDTTGGAIGYKKGGSVKGWGIARGARKAKIV